MNIDRDLGWIVAYSLIGIIFVFICANTEAFRALACAADEANCLREWLSALGGWAAVAAAVPTVIYLSRQVALARRQSYDDFQIRLHHLVALAKSAQDAASELESYSKFYMYEPGKVNSAAWSSISERMSELREMVKQEVLSRYEREIEYTRPSHRFVLERIKGFFDLHHSELSVDSNVNPEAREAICEDFNRICTYCDSFAVAKRESAIRFSIQAKSMVEGYK